VLPAQSSINGGPRGANVSIETVKDSLHALRRSQQSCCGDLTKSWSAKSRRSFRNHRD
jgi:hypothetical protein